MRWHRINRLLRPTGFKVVRAEASKPPKRRARGIASDPVYDRLVTTPVFILASIRSGSTLLRVLLNTHSQLHAPHELHLPGMRVELGSRYAMRAIEELGLDATALDYLLWDRVLHRELTKSGKKHIVEKTPSNVFIWRRIVECWPDARFIFLLRHPVAIARSRQLAWGRELSGENQRKVLGFMNGLERARRHLDGLTIRYEDLTTDPERVTQEVCAFLGVEWEPQMLDYGRVDHGRYEPGLGDWGERIRTGEILPPRPIPDGEIPERLLRLCRAWGYVEKPAAAGSPTRR
ncbi:MAG TPA: sulfotransferase [Gaiellaceae bacterium]|nr:sulfotransferase [Gaiellaceae bacterium]